jgi:hypothetical protein
MEMHSSADIGQRLLAACGGEGMRGLEMREDSGSALGRLGGIGGSGKDKEKVTKVAVWSGMCAPQFVLWLVASGW